MWVFETERLRARRWTAEDVDAAWVLYSDPMVTRYIGGITWADRAQAVAGIQRYIDRYEEWGDGLGGFPLIRRTDGALVGAALVRWLPGLDRTVATEDLEIGWHLAQRYWGNGYATEAGRAILAWGFERFGVDVVHAITDPDNTPSQLVCRRLGMAHLGRSTEYYGGVEVEKFAITREAWSP